MQRKIGRILDEFFDRLGSIKLRKLFTRWDLNGRESAEVEAAISRFGARGNHRDDLKPTLIGTLLIDCTLRQRCAAFINSLLDCTLLGDRCSAFRGVIATSNVSVHPSRENWRPVRACKQDDVDDDKDGVRITPAVSDSQILEIVQRQRSEFEHGLKDRFLLAIQLTALRYRTDQSSLSPGFTSCSSLLEWPR